MAAKGIRREYEKLRKKHKLPTFAELDNDFEISRIEAEGFPLREIRKKIIDKLHEVGSLVEEVLNPDTSLADLYESRIFGEEEKRLIFELYKKLMAFIRHSAVLAIQCDEKLEAEFIKSFYADWKKLKPELLKFATKIKGSWEKETAENESIGYMG